MSTAAAISFSVIIPAYNAAGTILNSVNAVLNQSFAPLEIIVVNDGSTDETERLLQENFPGRIRYIALPNNSGPAHARNVGLREASGTHIAFQDADDVWHREKLRTFAGLLATHPAIHFIYHPYTLAPLHFTLASGPLQVSKLSFLKLLFSNPIGTPCVVMKRTEEIRFNEKMHYMEDYDLFLRQAYKYGVHFLNTPFTQLGRPILSEGGQSSKRWKMRKGEFKAYLNLIKLNPLFVFVSFFLILFGLLKHGVKSFFPPRTNY